MWLLEMMIKFNRLGILKLSIMEKDLPAHRKCWACKRVFGDELLKLFVDMFQELNGISGDSNTAESEGQKCHSLIWWFSSQEQYYLILLKVGDQITWRPSFPSASWLEVQSHFPHSQTCHRWQVWWRLLGFSSFYLKCSCDSQHLPPHMALQRLASRV